MADSHTRKYLGDGAYVDCDGDQFAVFAHNGIQTTNIVYLDIDMLIKLVDYVKRTAPQHANAFNRS